MALMVTANIGSATIKVCEIQYSPKEVVVTKAFSVKIPEGTMEDGRILDIDALANFLTEEFTWRRINAKEITFTLRSSKIIAKEIYTPVLKGAKLADMIKANASAYFPMDLESYALTHKIVSQVTTEEGEKQLRVNVLVAPKEMVESYYELSQKMNFTLKFLDYNHNAAVSLLKKQIGPETSVVIHVHEDATSVNIFKNNVLELQRTVPYGRDVAVRAVMQHRNLRREEAEQLLNEERLIHNTFDGDEITESLRYLISSIVRVVDYYSSRNSESPVEKAYLTGDSVNMLGLENLFANEFDFSVMQIMNFDGVTIAPDLVMNPKELSLYITTIGAVLEPVNFDTEATLASKRKNQRNSLMILAPAGLVLLALIMIGIPFVQKLSIESDIDEIKEKIKQVQEIEQVVDANYAAKDKLTDIQQFINMTGNANDYMLEFIYALEKGQPSDVSIKSMSVANGQVSITAVTSTKQTIAKFITQLESMQGVEGVKVASTTEAKDEYGVVTSSFSIVCRFTSAIDRYVNPPEESTEGTEGTTTDAENATTGEVETTTGIEETTGSTEGASEQTGDETVEGEVQ